MKIKKGDTIFVMSGDDRGRSGKVIKVSPKKGMILVEGINMQKKHRRPRKEGEKGQIIEKPGFIPASNVKMVCPKCAKPAKMGHKTVGKKKFRICRKCGQEI